MPMGDREVAASIVAGDGDGLAEAYDRYSDPLYKYCRSILSDPADAADAVQDTFVIAASRLADLREPERLRAWLYAVARNECLRTPRVKAATLALADAPDDSADAGENAERAGLRRLLDDATAGLNPGDREIIELQLRQGLEPAEVAAVLGVSRNRAHSLMSHAREQLESCLGVLLIGRARQGDCTELSCILAGWHGQLTAALRKRVHRHVQRCATCSTGRAFELRPATLLGLSPGAAMAAAAADSLRVAAGAPTGLRAHTFALAADQDAGAIAYRAAVLNRAGSFGRDGFPRPAHRAMAAPARHAGAKGAKRALRSSPRRRATVAAGAVLAIIAVIAFALDGNTQHAKLASGRPPGSAPPPVASTAASAVAAAHPGKGSAAATPSRAPSQPAATPTPSLVTTTTTSPSTVPTTASPTPPPSKSPTPTPTTASPTPTPTPTPKPTPGTLNVNPPGGHLRIPQGGATIWLSAQGGPVTWSITVSGGPGDVSVSPSSGTLAEGRSVPVTITASHWASGDQVTVSPGGTVFTIVVDWRHHNLPRYSLVAVPGAATPYPISLRLHKTAGKLRY
jgi:RNA polymerase sigma factor (sigma-70 family)